MCPRFGLKSSLHMWVDFIASFSTMLREAFHSILRFFSDMKIKHLIGPDAEHMKNQGLTKFNNPRYYSCRYFLNEYLHITLLFHDRHWNQMGVSNVPATSCSYSLWMIFLPSRDSGFDLLHCMCVGLMSFAIGVCGKERRRTFASTLILWLSRKRNVDIFN